MLCQDYEISQKCMFMHQNVDKNCHMWVWGQTTGKRFSCLNSLNSKYNFNCFHCLTIELLLLLESSENWNTFSSLTLPLTFQQFTVCVTELSPVRPVTFYTLYRLHISWHVSSVHPYSLTNLSNASICSTVSAYTSVHSFQQTNGQ